MLFNECNIGKAKFKMYRYNIELSDNVGILYHDNYYLNKTYSELENNYNMIGMAYAEKW